jgi:1-acyl-sn-glycerol-3-phosphate acyltransferase
MVYPIAMCINFMQHLTMYKHRWRLNKIKKAVTVSNHTTFFDPVKITGLTLPFPMNQTMLEATVEFPFLGTLTRLLGGVPIPRGRTSYSKIFEICEKAFRFRKFMHFYPEGECFLYNQKINKFQSGAFRLAAELNVPVIPLVTVFSNGLFKPWSFWGRSLPIETLIVMDAIYPLEHIKYDEKNEICQESIKEFAEIVRQKMQEEIDRRKGSGAFYRGQMKRIKGLND